MKTVVRVGAAPKRRVGPAMPIFCPRNDAKTREKGGLPFQRKTRVPAPGGCVPREAGVG